MHNYMIGKSQGSTQTNEKEKKQQNKQMCRMMREKILCIKDQERKYCV